VDAVARWVVAWHAEGASPRALGPADVEHHLLAPARRLSAYLAPGYAARLARMAGALRAAPVALAPAHRDLTMYNVRLGPERIGILDWEAATAEALPFVDLPYALADAVTACGPRRDRLAAFERCFGTVGTMEAKLVQAALDRVSAAGCHDPGVLSCAFHACWLSHAGDDLMQAGADGAFVRIAQRLSADPDRYDPFARDGGDGA
jgi:hypothetical protein